MCGATLLGSWWIFPLVGFVFCLAFMAFFASRGRGMCMGGHRGARSGGVAETTRQ